MYLMKQYSQKQFYPRRYFTSNKHVIFEIETVPINFIYLQFDQYYTFIFYALSNKC